MARNDITGDEIKTRAITPAYKANHEKIFGNKKIERGRWIQDPVSGELISGEEYNRRQSKAEFLIMDRWDAYESETSGQIISNRKQRDYDLKSTGCRPYEGKQSELQEAQRHNAYKRSQLKHEMRETMEKTYYEIEHGYRSI